MLFLQNVQEPYHLLDFVPESWLNSYNELVFFQLYRMKKNTFMKGGNQPVSPEKAVLIFLWYMSKQDTLNSVADRFYIVPSTVLRIVNALLYIVIGLKKQYIFFPNTPEEQEYIKNQFQTYPDTIGAIDGTHVNIKVPVNQQDSYTDRYMAKSINLMAICTPKNIFTYIYIYMWDFRDQHMIHDNDFWENEIFFDNKDHTPHFDNGDREERQHGQVKRENRARSLYEHV